MREVRVATLGINYRTPTEVMTEAEPVIRAALPDANVPTSIRSSGIPVMHAGVADLDRILDDWSDEHDEGIACVIATERPAGAVARQRVRYLTPELCKGMEFDLVVLVDPGTFGGAEQGEITGAVDRYVAMTRATGQLAILTG
jgi:DNA helicase IV